MKVLGHMIQCDGGLRHEWQATRSAMWAAYWANCGNKACFKLGSVAKLGLLNKCVVSRISWKLPRWPMQKTVAVNLDSLQARMISALIPCARHSHEDIDPYDRRRKRLARNHCAKEGVWSKVWAKRMISWHEHIMRTCRSPHSFPHNAAVLLQYHDSKWLAEQRSVFVGSSRNSVVAGRSSTRLNIGRPQVRWQEGHTTSLHILEHRDQTARGNNSLSVGTIFRETVNVVRAALAS